GQDLPRVEEPVLARMGEEVVHLEGPEVRPAVDTNHQPELDAVLGPEDLRQLLHLAPSDRAMDLAPAYEARLRQARSEGGHDSLQVPHRPAISTIRSRSAVTGAGTLSPRRTRAAAQTPSGTTPQPPSPPERTPAGGAP